MASVTIQEAQAKLPDLIRKLQPGDEVVITENNRPVARLLSEAANRHIPLEYVVASKAWSRSG